MGITLKLKNQHVKQLICGFSLQTSEQYFIKYLPYSD